MDASRKLTRAEFDEVMRRAADLAATEPDPSDGSISEEEVLRIAGEVGIPQKYVHRALVDIRSPSAPTTHIDRWFGTKTLAAWRVAPGEEAELARKLQGFLVDGQLLKPVRSSRDEMTYRPATDWLSRFAHAAGSLAGTYYFASAREVKIELNDAGPGFTHVKLTVDPGIRQERLGASIFAGLVAAGAGVLVTPTLAVAMGLPMALGIGVGIFAAAAAAWGTVWAMARKSRRQLDEVRDEVEGVLDRLEAGEKLDPPPSSWRRWVRRQAKAFRVDLLGTGERDDEE